MLFLIAYDIADPRRLRRVARVMERHSVRTQKSVFVFRGDAAGLAAVLDQAALLLDVNEDVVQAWRLAADETPRGLVRGTALPCRPAGVVCAPGRQEMIRDSSSEL